MNSLLPFLPCFIYLVCFLAFRREEFSFVVRKIHEKWKTKLSCNIRSLEKDRMFFYNDWKHVIYSLFVYFSLFSPIFFPWNVCWWVPCIFHRKHYPEQKPKWNALLGKIVTAHAFTTSIHSFSLSLLRHKYIQYKKKKYTTISKKGKSKSKQNPALKIL